MASDSEVPPFVAAQLARAERILTSEGVPSPRDEAVALLSFLLGVPAALLLGLSEHHMSPSAVETYAGWVARRGAGEAMAHITGHLAFMGLDLTVERDTPLLAPGAQRVVEAALERARHHAPGELAAAELGTGCGAIALALAAFEPRFNRFHALDADARALRVAAANGARYLLNLVINWIEGGLDNVPEPVDLVVCGQLGTPVSAEAARLVEQARALLRPGGALVCGLDGAQGPMAARLLERAFPGAQVWMDPPADGAVVAVAQLPRPS